MKLDNVAELIKGLVDKTYQKYAIIPPSNFISQTHQHTSPLNSLRLCNSERFSYQRTVFAFIAYRVFVQYFQESEGSSIAD